MSYATRSVLECGLRPSADLITRGFRDYLVTIKIDEERLTQNIRVDGVDATLSRVAFWKDEPAGVALIARRGWTSRLAAMSIVPEARGQGVGRALVQQLLRESRERGDREMVLEVIEQNEPAARLYDACGFRRVRRTVGFRAEPWGKDDAPVPVEVDLREVAAALYQNVLVPNPPWQMSAETIAQLAPPDRGFRNEGAWIAIAAPAGQVVRIRALATKDGGPAAADAVVRLLQTIRAYFPAYPRELIALWPEDQAELFLRAGFARTPLSLLQMSHRLT